jgi:tight adherence protein B
VAFAAGLLGIALFLTVRPRRITARERLAHFLARDVYSDGPAVRHEEKATRAAGALERLEGSFAEHDWWTRLIEELDVARIESSPMRILSMTFAGTALTAFLIGRGMGIPILVPLSLLVPFGVRLYLNRRLRRQREEFGEQLADSLQLVASSLRAGQSMAGAFAIVIEQAPEPARSEFRRIADDERLGIPLEQGIRVVARRMDSRDMDQLALVATIQKETGGNSAEVIDQLIATIRERMALRRLMRTLTAQGRLTQIVVSALPVVLLIAISIIQPDYMEPLFETNGGHVALLIAAAMSIAGSLIIRRIVALRA